MQKKRQKDFKELEVAADSKETVPSRYHKISAPMNSQRLWQHAQDLDRLQPDKTGKEKRTQISTPSQEVLCNWHPLEKGKLIFLKGCSVAILNTLFDRSSTWKLLANTKQIPLYFCVVCFILVIFVLLGFICLIVLIFCFRDKGWRENMKLYE